MLAAADAATWRERDAELISPAYHRYSDLVVESAEGAHLHTVDGRDVLDFGCGIGVTNLGHRHPAVVAAVHEQVDRLWHTSVTAYHPQMIEAAAALVSIMPPSLDQVFFTNTGAEAVEGAIKLARRVNRPKRHHRLRWRLPRTYLRRALAHREQGHLPARHGTAAARHPSHPLSLLLPLLLASRTRLCEPGRARAAAALRHHDRAGHGGGDHRRARAGRGRLRCPAADLHADAARVCDEHGIMLVADEVQSGFGRTGGCSRSTTPASSRTSCASQKRWATDADRRVHLARHRVMQRVPRGRARHHLRRRTRSPAQPRRGYRDA